MRSIQGESGNLPPKKLNMLLQRFPNKPHVSWKWRNIFSDCSFWELCRSVLEKFALLCSIWRVKGKTLFSFFGVIVWVAVMLYLEIKSSEENLAFCCGLGTPSILEPCNLLQTLEVLCSLSRIKTFDLSCIWRPLHHLVPLPLDAPRILKPAYKQRFPSPIICKYLVTTYFVHSPCKLLPE